MVALVHFTFTTSLLFEEAMLFFLQISRICELETTTGHDCASDRHFIESLVTPSSNARIL